MEDLHAKLRGLEARLKFLALYPMPFDNEARMANLRRAIKEVKSQIDVQGIEWVKYGF